MFVADSRFQLTPKPLPMNKGHERQLNVNLTVPGGIISRFPPNSMALERGTHLGPYQIESPIGAGGMGEAIFRVSGCRRRRREDWFEELQAQVPTGQE